MHKYGYYDKLFSGTPEEITEKARWHWDKLAVEFLQDKVSARTRMELEKAVEEYDYLSEYKGLILFDDTLPIPPGCDPNKDWDYSPPTAHQHSHKY